jgi:hypothetical protein
MSCEHTKIFSGKPTYRTHPLPPVFEWICRECHEAGYQDKIISGFVNPADDDMVDQDLFAQLKCRVPPDKWRIHTSEIVVEKRLPWKGRGAALDIRQLPTIEAGIKSRTGRETCAICKGKGRFGGLSDCPYCCATGVVCSTCKKPKCDHTEPPVMHVRYEPGNGTSYSVLFMNLDQLDSEAKDRIGLGSDGTGVLVTLVNYPTRPSIVIRTDMQQVLAWTYVAEKLNGSHNNVSISDAIVLTELIGHVVKRPIALPDFLEEDQG